MDSTYGYTSNMRMFTGEEQTGLSLPAAQISGEAYIRSGRGEGHVLSALDHDTLSVERFSPCCMNII